MNLQQFALQELQAAGLFDQDSDYNGMLGTAVLQLINVFSEQGHSGGSAAMVASIFNKLARYQPLTPIQGTDDEWVDVAEQNGGPLWQNKRCFAIFKDPEGAYYLDAVVYREPNGSTFTRGRHPIAFPYTPQTQYINVDENGNEIK